MPVIDHHLKPYDDGTQQKLRLFRNYIRSWLGVFCTQNFKTVYMIDAFAGPGNDESGEKGTPLIILEEVANQFKNFSERSIVVEIHLNENNAAKLMRLEKTVDSLLNKFPELRQIVSIHFTGDDALNIVPVLVRQIRDEPCLLLLDQNGIMALKEDIFDSICSGRRLDALFFVATSYLKRFAQEPEFLNYVRYLNIDALRSQPSSLVHRELKRQLATKWNHKGLYFSDFTIKKNNNVYGILLCTHHLKALDVFVSHSWKENNETGDANFDIDGTSLAQEPMFENMRTLSKLDRFKDDLEGLVRSRELTNNIDVYVHTITSGILPEHARKVLSDLKKNGTVVFKGHSLISYESWKHSSRKEFTVLS